MIQVAICDDNELQRELILDLLNEYKTETGENIHISVFSTGEELEKAAKSGSFNLYILDVIMPGMNGLELASLLRIRGDEGLIIFLTASLEYAAVSYDVDAFYYLLKPVDRDKLFKTLNRAVEKLGDTSGSVVVKTKKGLQKITIDSIIYVDIVNRSLRYHLRDGSVIEGLVIRVPFRESVADIAADERFAQCGVSMLINLGCIDQIDSESVLLRNGELLYPSKAACAELKKTRNSFLSK